MRTRGDIIIDVQHCRSLWPRLGDKRGSFGSSAVCRTTRISARISCIFAVDAAEKPIRQTGWRGTDIRTGGPVSKPDCGNAFRRKLGPIEQYGEKAHSLQSGFAWHTANFGRNWPILPFVAVEKATQQTGWRACRDSNSRHAV